MILFGFFLFLFAALALLWLAKRRQQAAGLPGGRIIYADMRGWQSVEKPLYDPILGLTGKPDYLVQKGGQIIPVEVKSTRSDHSPYDSHIFQLAAYCLLVQNVLGKRPAYGLLHYSGGSQRSRTFVIDYTAQLEEDLLALLVDMRGQDRRKEVNRSHDSAARCARCGFHSICDQRIQ
jgi:CRISPR-associated exonuclease Cas4